MAKIAVYHMTSAAFRGEGGSRGYIRDDAELVKSVMKAAVGDGVSEYVYCARIKTRIEFPEDTVSAGHHLERAWKDTNNIDHSWTENESVIFSAAREQRSSMVGDLFWYNELLFMVAPCGFKMVGKDEEESKAVARVIVEASPVGTGIPK